MKKYIPLILSILIAEAAGGIGSIFTSESIPNWYAYINKPSFNPPNWVFGPVWTTLFILMGIAAYLIWKEGSNKKEVRSALLLYGAQLIANTMWSIIFFGLKAPGAAFIEIIALWILILLTIVYFWRLKPIAGLLLLPYIAWVSFASILNFFIWRLN